MIIGVGIDIIEVKRVEKALRSCPERVFTLKECEYFTGFKYTGQHMAGTWAAKEAVAKAFGTGFAGISHKDIEIIRVNGAPRVTLHGKAKIRFDELGGKRIFVSISHVDEMACANAVLEG